MRNVFQSARHIAKLYAPYNSSNVIDFGFKIYIGMFWSLLLLVMLESDGVKNRESYVFKSVESDSKITNSNETKT